MIPRNDTKSFTVRLPAALYDATAALALAQKVSMNALIQDRLAQLVREQEARQLYDAFSLVGDDSESDTAFALEAQAEVAIRDEL